jgi:hypothetical protein
LNQVHLGGITDLFEQDKLWTAINNRMVDLNVNVYETNTNQGQTPTGKARQKEWTKKIADLKQGNSTDAIGGLENWPKPSMMLDDNGPNPPLD